MSGKRARFRRGGQRKEALKREKKLMWQTLTTTAELEKPEKVQTSSMYGTLLVSYGWNSPANWVHIGDITV